MGLLWAWGPVWLQSWALPKILHILPGIGVRCSWGAVETGGHRPLAWNQKLGRSQQSHFAAESEWMCVWGWPGSWGHLRGLSPGCRLVEMCPNKAQSFVWISLEQEVSRNIWRSWRHQITDLWDCYWHSSSGLLWPEQSPKKEWGHVPTLRCGSPHLPRESQPLLSLDPFLWKGHFHCEDFHHAEQCREGSVLLCQALSRTLVSLHLALQRQYSSTSTEIEPLLPPTSSSG